jgi:hypothetical protein
MKPYESCINQSTKKKEENTRNKMKGLTAKKPKEPPKKVRHKGNIKFPNPLMSQEAYQIKKREDLLKGGKSSHYVEGAKEAACKLLSNFHKLLLFYY